MKLLLNIDCATVRASVSFLRARSVNGVILAALLGFSAESLATTSNVPGPGIKAGDSSWEYRSSYQDRDQGPAVFHQRLHYQIATNDRQRYRFIVQQGQVEGNSLEFNWARFEYQWQYKKPEGNAGGAGLRFDLQVAEGDNQPHFARLVWIKSRQLGSWQSGVNLLLGKDFGEQDRSGASLGARASLSRVIGEYRVGGQYFGDLNTTSEMGSFDRQSHQAGLTVSRQVNGWNLFASYLAGISDRAPDHALRLFIGRSL